MSILRVNEIQVFNGTTVTITCTTAETSSNLNVGGDLVVSGSLTLGAALAVTEGGTGSTSASGARTALGLVIGTDVQAYDADTTKNDASNTFTANQVISVTDNSNPALKITQIGTANALVVEDSSGDSTPFVVDGSGNVGIGNSSPSQKLDVTGNINATGELTLGTALAISQGGTGATDAATARTNLGLATVASSGDYTDLSNTPSIPSSINDLSDVTITTPASGQVLTYNGANWVNQVPSAGNAIVYAIALG